MKRLSTVCLMFALAAPACTSDSKPQTTPSGSGGSGGAVVTGTGGSMAGSGGAAGGGGSGTGGGSGGSAVVDASSGADQVVRPDAADAPVAVDTSAERPVLPNADCPQGALMCDDFEGYALGGDLSPNWTTEIIKGNVQVETSKPFRGTKGVHLSTTLSPPGEPVRTHGGPLRAATLVKTGAPLFPAPGNAFWGRVMVWLTRMPQDGSMGGVHFSNIEASGKLPNGQLVKYGEGGMFRRLLAGYTVRPADAYDLPIVDCGKNSPTGIPEGRWVCIEWHMDGANNGMHMWFDGQLQTAVDVNGAAGNCSWRAPPFDKLFLGWRHSQPSPIDVDMWMDNIVIDTKRINCPAP